MHDAHNGLFRKKTFLDITFYFCEYKQMAKSEGRGLGYGPPCDTVSRPDITLPRIIGCADMPRGAVMPLLPLRLTQNQPTLKVQSCWTNHCSITSGNYVLTKQHRNSVNISIIIYYQLDYPASPGIVAT